MISKNEQLQVAASSGNGRVGQFGELLNVTVYVRSVGPVSAGAVQLEEADSPSSTTFAAVGAAITPIFSDGGLIVVHLTGCYAWLRARISSAIVGGTVSVLAVANF